MDEGHQQNMTIHNYDLINNKIRLLVYDCNIYPLFDIHDSG